MNSLHRKIVLSILILLVGQIFSKQLLAETPAKAAEEKTAVPSLSLATLTEQALIRNPDIIAMQAEWQAARQRRWTESSLPDPMAGYDLMGSMVETRVGPQQNRFMFSQDIPFPLKLWEKGRAAGDEAKAAQARLLATERDVVNELEKLYYDFHFVDASIQSIHEIKDILRKFENVAQSRYSNLSGTQRDVAKAQAEVSLSLERLFMLEQQRESISAMINALLDQDPMTELGKAEQPEKPSLKYSLIELVNLSVKNRKEIQEMEALVSKSERGKRLAQLNFIPDLNIGFEYTQVENGMTEEPDDGQDSWMFPLRINLPIWLNRNIPEIKEAKQNVIASRARLLKAKNTTFLEVKDAYSRYTAAAKIVELYETAVIPQAKLALSADQAGYESAKADFLNLLDSERVYLNARLTYHQFFTEMLKSYSDLVRATGLDLDEVKPAEEGERT